MTPSPKPRAGPKSGQRPRDCRRVPSAFAGGRPEALNPPVSLGSLGPSRLPSHPPVPWRPLRQLGSLDPRAGRDGSSNHRIAKDFRPIPAASFVHFWGACFGGSCGERSPLPRGGVAAAAGRPSMEECRQLGLLGRRICHPRSTAEPTPGAAGGIGSRLATAPSRRFPPGALGPSSRAARGSEAHGREARFRATIRTMGARELRWGLRAGRTRIEGHG